MEEDIKPNSILSGFFPSLRAKYGQRVLLAAAPDSSPAASETLKAFVEVSIPTALCLLPALAMHFMSVYIIQWRFSVPKLVLAVNGA